MSYSSAKANPPWVCMHMSAARHDASEASSFAMFASAPHASPDSKSDAARRHICAAASVAAYASAMGNWIPWLRPMGRPNTCRSVA